MRENPCLLLVCLLKHAFDKFEVWFLVLRHKLRWTCVVLLFVNVKIKVDLLTQQGERKTDKQKCIKFQAWYLTMQIKLGVEISRVALSFYPLHIPMVGLGKNLSRWQKNAPWCSPPTWWTKRKSLPRYHHLHQFFLSLWVILGCTGLHLIVLKITELGQNIQVYFEIVHLRPFLNQYFNELWLDISY